ncbi:MAG: flippase-like domain-containing protein [Pirellulales bacterium]|nr:flippase-like domain-containing protein [Pirellulales bacterium]
MNSLFPAIAGKKSVASWLAGLLISSILLGLVIFQIEPDDFLKLAGRINSYYFIPGIIFLFLEGIFTSLRVHKLNSGRLAFATSLRVTAWYVLFLLIIPARLGELSMVVLLNRHMNLSYGSAVTNLLVQKLLDLLVLALVFLFSSVVVFELFQMEILVIIAFVIVMAMIVILLRLEGILTIIAAYTFRFRAIISRKILFNILRSRSWARHHMTQKLVLEACSVTFLKWLCNIAGFICIMYSLDLSFGMFRDILVSITYNFLAIIPLQTIGGIGLGEAGLMGILALFGMPLTSAASASILMRIGFILAPIVFSAVILSGLYMKTRSEN